MKNRCAGSQVVPAWVTSSGDEWPKEGFCSVCGRGPLSVSSKGTLMAHAFKRPDEWMNRYAAPINLTRYEATG